MIISTAYVPQYSQLTEDYFPFYFYQIKCLESDNNLHLFTSQCPEQGCYSGKVSVESNPDPVTLERKILD